MVKTIEGDTRECLAHFFDSIFPTNTLMLRDILGIGKEAENRWRYKQILPSGVKLLKLRYFLVDIGYTVTDFQYGDELVTDIGRCIAYGIISPQDIAAELQVRDDYVFTLWLKGGKHRMQERRMKQVENMVAAHRSELSTKVKEQKAKIETFLEAKNEVVGDIETLIADFDATCAKLRTMAQDFLVAPVDVRHRLRRHMSKGSSIELQELHMTWEKINKLLKEPIVR